MARDANVGIMPASEPPVVASILSMHHNSGGDHHHQHSGNTNDDVNVTMTPNQVAEAYRATMSEHRMTFSEAVKTHKKALFWSAVMGLVSGHDHHYGCRFPLHQRLI